VEEMRVVKVVSEVAVLHITSHQSCEPIVCHAN